MLTYFLLFLIKIYILFCKKTLLLCVCVVCDGNFDRSAIIAPP